MADVTARSAAGQGRFQRYVALDGLRGFAALSVMMFHLQPRGLYPLPTDANHAVDLFFIMSGFVIAGVYEAKLPTLGTRKFMEQRLVRLYPTYFLSLMILPVFMVFDWTIASRPLDLTPYLESLPFQLLYLPSPPALLPPDHGFYFLNGPGWTLFWELVVNLAYALLLPWLSRKALLATILVSAAALIGCSLTGTSTVSGADWGTWPVGLGRVLYGFPLGVLMFRLPRPRFDTPFVIVLALAAVTLVLPSLLSLFVLLPLIAWLATGCSTQSRFLAFAGALSYPLYAIHTPLYSFVEWIAVHALHLSLIGTDVLLVVVPIVAAWLVLRFWDEPVRAALRRRHPATLTERAPAL